MGAQLCCDRLIPFRSQYVPVADERGIGRVMNVRQDHAMIRLRGHDWVCVEHSTNLVVWSEAERTGMMFDVRARTSGLFSVRLKHGDEEPVAFTFYFLCGMGKI